MDFTSSKISPCFGSFDGLPSLYITVSGLECLYDDAVMVYDKANEAMKSCAKQEQYENVQYILEVVHGSSLHELPLMAGVISEATTTLRNIARFLVNITSSVDRNIYI